MARSSLSALLAISTICLIPADGAEAAKASSLPPPNGTVQMMLNRLRAKGLCSARPAPGYAANLCRSTIAKRFFIGAYPDRLDAQLEAVNVSMIIENADPRTPPGEVERSTRAAFRLIHELFPRWIAGTHWLKGALKKARTTECAIETHVEGYNVSLAGTPAMDYNLTTATLVIARADVAAKYRHGFCE